MGFNLRLFYTDNTQLNAGAGGDIISTDDLGGVKVQNTKVVFGADGAMTRVTPASPLPVDPSGVTSPISAAALPLPTGAATAANQALEIAALAAIESGIPITNFPATQPISAAALPLPSGAATSANQGTEITALNQLHTDLIAPLPAGTNLLGKVGIDQTTPGTTNAVQANAGTNLNTSLLALEAGGNLAAIKADVDKIPSQGQAAAAAST